MIVVTGGAGFIGSRLVAALNCRGRRDILIVDHLGAGEKWKNLLGLEFAEYLDRSQFLPALEAGAFDGRLEAVFHLGACSSTTEKDAGYLLENNYRYSLRLAEWRSNRPDCRFIYASSAATYGDGRLGYGDDEARLARLRPLNAYGFSKHLFDLTARERGWLRGIAGLKYFNVFGPNEGHKGEMRSLVSKSFARVRDEGLMRLFKSHRPDYADGEQVRDFIYVDDAVAMTLFFFDHPEANGLFNIGSGEARTWNDLARALFAALGRPPRIEYVSMPESLRQQYQYYTRADLTKLRAAGCGLSCRSLEEAVREYVSQHLIGDQEGGERGFRDQGQDQTGALDQPRPRAQG